MFFVIVKSIKKFQKLKLGLLTTPLPPCFDKWPIFEIFCHIFSVDIPMVTNKQFLQMGSFGKGFCKPETKVTDKAVRKKKLNFQTVKIRLHLPRLTKLGAAPSKIYSSGRKLVMILFNGLLHKGLGRLGNLHLRYLSAAGCILSRSLSTTQWSGSQE